MEPEHLVFNITAGIEKKRLYTATVSLVGIEGVVQVLMLNFSELCVVSAVLVYKIIFKNTPATFCCLQLLKLY